MRLRRLSLLKYGVFEDRTFDFGDGTIDLHLIVGPNEAGKSTLLSGISDLLFNIPERTPYGFRHGMSDLAIAACLEHGGETLDLVRRKKRKDPLTTPQGEALAESVLYPFLGGADRDTFGKMFGLNQTRMREGGDSFLEGAPQAARAVLEAEGGLAGLGGLLAELDTQADGLFAPNARTKPLNIKLAERKDAEQRARDQAVDERQWTTMNARQAAAETLRRGLIARLAEVAGRMATLERIRRVRPLLAALDGRARELAPLVRLPHLPADAEPRRLQAERQLTAGDARLQTLREALERARSVQEEAVDALLLAEAETIERLLDGRGVYEDRRRALPRRADDLAGLSAAIARLKTDGGLAALSDPPAKIDRDRLRLAFEAAREARATLQRLSEADTRLRRDLEDETRRLATIGAVDGLTSLRVRLEQAPRDVARQRAASRRALEAAAQRAAQELARLRPWPGEPATLSAASPPAEAVIDETRTRFTQLDSEAAELRRALSEAEARLIDTRAALSKLNDDGAALPTPAVLAAARQARDTAWTGLREAPLGDLEDRRLAASAYERLVREADDLADRRQTEADRLAAHLMHSVEAGRHEARAAAARAGLAEVADRLAEASAAWAAHCRQLGFADAITPAEMSAWAQARQRALEAQQALADLSTDAVEVAVQVERHLSALAEAVTAAEPGATIEDDPDALIAQVAAMVRKLEERQLERSRVEEVVARLGAEMRRSGDAVALETLVSERRTRDLAEAVAACGLAGVSDEVALAAALAAFDTWVANLGAHDQMAERVRLIQADLVEFEGDVARLLARLGRTAEPDMGLTLQRLGEALEVAKAVQVRSEGAAREAAGITREMTTLQDELGAAGTDLAELVTLAGLDDPSGLAEVIAQAASRDHLEADLDRLRRELDEAGDGHPVDVLRDEVATLEPDVLAAEMSTLEAERHDLGDQRDAAAAELTEAAQEINLQASGSNAAAALQEAEDARAEASTQAERYVEARSVGALLRWAITRHRRTRAGPLIARASQIMATVTAGAFDGLDLDFEQGDDPVVVGVRASGERLASAAMSEGARDQLYLALRLAAVEERAARHPLPFIADDLLVNGDDERCAAILGALAHLARRTQVLCFTHHEHLVPIAEHTLGPKGFRLHRMARQELMTASA
ncbi:MAG: AAA family ATPase [Pseudomonadota bacterium]